MRPDRAFSLRQAMAFVDIAFGINHYNCVFFPYLYNRYKDVLKQPTVFLVSGHKGRENNVLVSELVDVVEVAAANDWRPDSVVNIGSRRVAKKLKRRKAAA